MRVLEDYSGMDSRRWTVWLGEGDPPSDLLGQGKGLHLQEVSCTTQGENDNDTERVERRVALGEAVDRLGSVGNVLGVGHVVLVSL